MHTVLDLAGSLPVGVIIVDEFGFVLWHNRTAALIISNNPVISIQGGILFADAHTAELHALIKAATGAASDPCAISIRRHSEAFPLSVLVKPIVWRTEGEGDQRVRAVIIGDPMLPRMASRTVLQRLYGFTETEAGVACQLMNGGSLANIAKRLNISSNTIRTHLKKLFQKTGTARQSELVWLLLSGPALLAEQTEISAVPGRAGLPGNGAE